MISFSLSNYFTELDLIKTADKKKKHFTITICQEQGQAKEILSITDGDYKWIAVLVPPVLANMKLSFQFYF